MKRTIQAVLILLISGLFIVGCGQEESGTDTAEMIDVSVTISVDNGEEIIAEDSFEVEDGTILLDLLEESYQIEKMESGFITMIEGVEQDNERYWLYQVNGEDGLVGAAEFELSPEDDVVFDLHGMK